MRKRVVSLAMAAAMALSLTACGSSSSKTETTAAATEAAKTETTAAAEGAATEAAASGVDTSAWKDKTVTCIVPYDAGGGTDGRGCFFCQGRGVKRCLSCGKSVRTHFLRL